MKSLTYYTWLCLMSLTSTAPIQLGVHCTVCVAEWFLHKKVGVALGLQDTAPEQLPTFSWLTGDFLVHAYVYVSWDGMCNAVWWLWVCSCLHELRKSLVTG